MWVLHDVVGRVILQMCVLMVVFSVVQEVRRAGVTRLYFTGVLFSGGLLIANGVLGVVLAVVDGRAPSALHLAYGLVAIFTLPTIHYFEQQSPDDRRALHLYTVAFIVLLISVWRSAATAGM